MELLHQNQDTGLTHELGGLVTACTMKTVRRGAPGQLALTILPDPAIVLQHGDVLALRDGTRGVFYGYIFKLEGSEKEEVKVTAYDQIRYLKNKACYLFQGRRADQIVADLCADFGVETGELEQTGHVIPSLIMDNQTLLDTMLEAIDQTLVNTGELYILWDDYGALRLSEARGHCCPLMLGEGSLATGHSWKSDIDAETANQVKLVSGDKDKGWREEAMVCDSNHIGRWGLLQHLEVVDGGQNPGQLQAQAGQMLELYNRPKVSLDVDALAGDLALRGGMGVYLHLPSRRLTGWHMVEECTHDIMKETMKLKLVTL